MATVNSLVCWGGKDGKTATMTIASPCVVTITSHGLHKGTGIVFSTTGALPTGIIAGVTYYVGNVATSTFNLYDTEANALTGGATGRINTSGSQSGTHTATSAYWSGLTTEQKARYGTAGSERAYDGLRSWNSGRSGASSSDIEVCEIGESFTDYGGSTSAVVLDVPASKFIVTTKVNGIYGNGFHNGNLPTNRTNTSGYELVNNVAMTGISFLVLYRYNAEVTGIIVRQTISYGTSSLVALSKPQTLFEKSIVYGYSTTQSTGIYVSSPTSRAENNLVYNCQRGFNFSTYNAGLFTYGNIALKCGIGFGSSSTASAVYGFVYNNISIGCTTNWASGFTALEGASNNAGISTDTPWGSNPVTVATTDFVDYANNDLRPAASTSPQVDTAFEFYGISVTDIANNERPSYNNGGSEAFDVGCYEYDMGYGPHPSTDTRGIEFTGLVAGSKVKVFVSGTDTEKFSTASSGTSETWEESVSGSIVVDYVILKAGYLPIRSAGITVTASSSGATTIPITQIEDRAYAASSGLTLDTNVFVNPTTKKFGLTTTSTVQNLYSYLIEQWITLGDTTEVFANVEFPLVANGPNSFTWLNGWEADLTTYSSTITNLSRDGMRYLDVSDTITAIYAAILSVGDVTGMQLRYQQTDGGTTVDTNSTGVVDQLIQIYGDATHGNFDYTNYLVIKAQEDGYDEAVADVYGTYGTMEDQLYVIGLQPLSNGLTTGDPALANPPTITDHGASPVTWNGKSFSITITDSAAGNSGENIMRWLRYNFAQGGTFQGKDGFNWHDLVQTNGSYFKTVRGVIYGDTGATLKGVRVVTNGGSAAHPDFTLFTADDGTTYSPPTSITISNSNLASGSRVRLYNVTKATELENTVLASTGYSYVTLVGAAEAVSVGDTIRLTATYASGTSYKKNYSESAVASTSNMTFIGTQETWTEANALSIDGSLQTEFATDYVNVEVDVSASGNTFGVGNLIAWLIYTQSTADGIRNFFGSLTARDAANWIINTSVVDLELDNVNAATATQDDSIILMRDDSIYPQVVPTSGGGGIGMIQSGLVFVTETGVSGLTAGESAKLDIISTVHSNQSVINTNVKKASLGIPASTDVV